MSERLLEPTPSNLEHAAERLRSGGLVGMPTETVYGLAADSDNEEAVRQVFITKGRPIDNPLIVHVSNPDQARALSPDWNATCDRLAERFWPGPLTLVLVHGGRVNDYVTAGHPTVARRSPAHDTALELIRAAGRPLVAPSANRSGQVSPTTAAHVLDEFPAESFPVLDGGPCSHGIESTVLALSDEIPVVLRPGAVTLAELR
ncbi:MAG: threonylcarbamoyl-AMP synthase, partial [Phycisphaeraceae bacterium]|nr:threonylcarbamoyl-AMP synthase [Phycisphaeraceae bacterium]